MALTRTQLANPDCHVSDGDYEAIEAAIMETARGRWFLFEFARRNRHADTQTLLSAINRLENVMTGQPRAAAHAADTQAFAAASSGQAATARQLHVVRAGAPPVEPLPGPAAVTPDLPVAGVAIDFDADRFTFQV